MLYSRSNWSLVNVYSVSEPETVKVRVNGNGIPNIMKSVNCSWNWVVETPLGKVYGCKHVHIKFCLDGRV